MRKYKIPYPYTSTIFALIAICSGFLVYYHKEMNWTRYLNTLGFSLIFGLIQINELENTSSKPAWYFPDGASFFQDKGISFYKNIIIEDLLFIPVCTTLFYGFMSITQNVPDVLHNPYVISYSLLFFMLYEAFIWGYGGKAAKSLITIYTVCPILLLLMVGFDFSALNFTHLALSLIFVTAVNDIWEIFNAWRGHWKYDKDCELLSDQGWFFGDKLHVSIFCQYPVSGFVVMSFCWNFFK